jgi:hypothetical protein
MKVPLILKEVETRTEDSAEREQITQILEVEENSISKYPVNLLLKFGPKQLDFSGRKNSSACLPFGGEVKPSVPCGRFSACKRTQQLRGSRIVRLNFTGHFSPIIPPFAPFSHAI